MADKPETVKETSRTKAQTGGKKVVIDEKFALEFAKALPAKRKKILSSLNPQQKKALAQTLAGIVNDPKRSMFDDKGQSLPAMMEYSPNGAKVDLAREALKTIAEVSPDIALATLKEALGWKTRTDNVKFDYVRILEYLGNKKPGFRAKVIKVLSDYMQGKKLSPYSSADQANRVILRLQGKPEPPWD